MPDIRAKCRQYRLTPQQDDAPSHAAKNTINYLKRENVSFIEPQMWPPDSPDLNGTPLIMLLGCSSASNKSSITENLLLSNVYQL